MKYIPYNSLNEQEYLILKSDFDLLKNELISFMHIKNFEPALSKFSDVIGIGFEKKSNLIFKGGIGVSFDDESGNKKFSLHIIKTLDREHGRYYKQQIIVDNFNLEELKKEYKTWFLVAIEKYNSITEKDLTEYIKFSI